MSRHFLPAMICLGVASAFAQPMQSGAPEKERQNAREQRRVELRNALLLSRTNKTRDAGPEAPAAGGRHLSAGERAEMRQQLRQQEAADQRRRP